MYNLYSSTHLPSDIEPQKAADAFKSQLEELTLLLQSSLPTITTKLYSRSIISKDALCEAVNENHIASVRTVSLLSVVEDKIRAKPHVFTEFVKILESEPTLRSQANELVKIYHHGMFLVDIAIYAIHFNLLSGLDVSVPHTSAATPSAISRYGDYLEGVYSKSAISSDGKWPPTPSKTYVNLAVVEHANQIRDLEEVRQNTLHGRVDELLKGKTKIEITDILKPQDDGSPVSLVFVEGPPGIGKSTLAWELCRKWDRKQYDLAVLLSLREREVQDIKSVADFFPHEDKDLQQSVAKEVQGGGRDISREGKGVLIILDGYDELPDEPPTDLRHQGLLTKLLRGRVLPKCSIIVTSRPSASKDLFRHCRPQKNRHVEILGFTQESVKDYASSVLSSKPEVLNDFLIYISASQNPAINSLMYIPLNAAIMVEIYEDNRRKGCPIPETMTQVYTHLCLTLLERYLDNIKPQKIDSFSDLPNAYSKHFKELARLAFEQFQQNRIVFCSVPQKLVHFGFLDSVPALYSGRRVSYNFLHLTLQEFLAAYHIKNLPNRIHVFDSYCKDSRWEVVWRFLSGLTEFKYFKNRVQNPVFSSPSNEMLIVRDLFLHCLFEGQLQGTFDFLKATGMKTVSYRQFLIMSKSSPLDRYALGYCIANYCPSPISWEVDLVGGSDESFIWGLNSNHSGNGIISHLTVESSAFNCDSYPQKILHSIKHLKLYVDMLCKMIPPMRSLTSLSLACYEQELCHTFLTSLSNLIQSPKLKCLSIGQRWNQEELTYITKPFCGILFGPSSLNELILSECDFDVDLLETNTCLSRLSLSRYKIATPFQTLSKILRNKTIKKLEIRERNHALDWEHLDIFKAALAANTSLEELTWTMSMLNLDQHCKHGHCSPYDQSLLINDPRVTIGIQCIICNNTVCV